MSFQQDLIAALPRLGRYALSLTREPDAARDLVQSTALRALASAKRPPEESLLPWLIRIARNAFVDERRRAARHDDLAFSLELDDRDEVGTRELAVRQALARLGPASREVVILVDVEGLTYREAAERLGLPPGTVMSRLSRARRNLLALLSDEDGGRSESRRS